MLVSAEVNNTSGQKVQEKEKEKEVSTLESESTDGFIDLIAFCVTFTSNTR